MRSLIFALLLSLVPDASLVAGVMPRQATADFGSSRIIAQATPLTREYMIGEWVTRNVEFGRDVEVMWTVRADGSLAYRFTVDGVSSDGSPGTWSIDNDVVTEVWQRPFGLTGTGTAKLEAIDADTLRLTIIDNGHPEYTGLVRIYRRRGGPQVSMLAP